MVCSCPLDSPLEIRCIVIGGNSRLAASERPIGAPSRTRAAASVTASRIGRLMIASLAMRSASSTGTALAVRMLSVRVKLRGVDAAHDASHQRQRQHRPVHPPARLARLERAPEHECAQRDRHQQPQAVVAQEAAGRDQHARGERQLRMVGFEYVHHFGHDIGQQDRHDREAHDRQHQRIQHRPDHASGASVRAIRCTRPAARAPHRGGPTARRPRPWRGRSRGTRAGNPPGRSRACGLRPPWRARRARCSARAASRFAARPQAAPPPAAAPRAPASTAAGSSATGRRPTRRAAKPKRLARCRRDSRAATSSTLTGISCRSRSSVRTCRAVSPSMTPLRDRPPASRAVYSNAPMDGESNPRASRAGLLRSWSRP